MKIAAGAGSLAVFVVQAFASTSCTTLTLKRSQYWCDHGKLTLVKMRSALVTMVMIVSQIVVAVGMPRVAESWQDSSHQVSVECQIKGFEALSYEEVLTLWPLAKMLPQTSSSHEALVSTAVSALMVPAPPPTRLSKSTVPPS